MLKSSKLCIIADGDTDGLHMSEYVEVPELIPGSGQVVITDHLIRFEHVPLVTPNGDVLIPELNFEVCIRLFGLMNIRKRWKCVKTERSCVTRRQSDIFGFRPLLILTLYLFLAVLY